MNTLIETIRDIFLIIIGCVIAVAIIGWVISPIITTKFLIALLLVLLAVVISTIAVIALNSGDCLK